MFLVNSLLLLIPSKIFLLVSLSCVFFFLLAASRIIRER